MNCRPVPSLKKSRVRSFRVSENDVRTAVVVQVAGGNRVRGLRAVGDVKPRREVSLPVVQIDDQRSRPFVADSEIDRAIPVEVRGSGRRVPPHPRDQTALVLANPALPSLK